jgi:hypothetical protein
MVTRAFGTVPGGGPFENVFVLFTLTAGNRIHHHEIFDVGDAERALILFGELCSGARDSQPET